MRPVRPRLLAKARRRHAEAPAKDAREVRRRAVADQPRHVAHRDRRLLGQELRRDRHAPRQQVLVEARLAELGISALQLARRARHRPRHDVQRERPAVVALDHDPRQQVQPASARQRL
jgi:hypothetical protein